MGKDQMEWIASIVSFRMNKSDITEDFKKKVEHFKRTLKGVCNYENEMVQSLLNNPLLLLPLGNNSEEYTGN